MIFQTASRFECCTYLPEGMPDGMWSGYALFGFQTASICPKAVWKRVRRNWSVRAGDGAMRLDIAAGRPLCGQGGSSLWQTFRPAVYAFVRQPCGLSARMVWFGG